jgi:predicted  nucleic acid-binding Zn-ribbon protein
MTALTGFVFWSVVSRLPTVFSDTKAVAKQIKELEEQIHAKTESPESQETAELAITSIRKQEDKAQQDRTGLNDKVARLQSDLEATQKREQELREQEKAEEKELDKHKQRLKEVLGREIEIHPGPPLHYDPGPEPKAPWYGGKIAYWAVGGKYADKWDAWNKARRACEAFNAFQDVTGAEIVDLQGRIESFSKQISVFNEKLEAVNARLSALGHQLKRYTDAPATAWDDLNELRKRLANTSFVRNVFWALDIPTLLSCIATTAVAYSRMCLISGRFSQRQLVRSRS